MMQTDFKRTLCLFLAAVTAALPLTLASCSEKAADPSSDTAGGGSGQSQTVSGNQASPEDAPETEAPAPEIDPGLIDELPTDVKYDGEDYVVLSHDHGAAAVAWMVQDIWTEGETGERINDAVFQRNLMMEDRFGVKVAQRLESDPQAVARTAVTTGADEFAILQTTVQNQAANAINGLTLNMARLPHLNFDKGWWDTSATKSLAVGGKVYYAIGDSQLNAKKATWGVLFNKRLVSDAGIPNLYETVKEGSWTIDLLKEYGTSIARDVNGDGTMTWGEDVWGLGLQNEVVLPLLLGTGEKIIDVHDDGTYDYNLGSDANMTAMERIWNFMNTDADYILNANKHSEIASVWVEFRKLFMADQIAFFMGHLGTPTLVAGDMESDFGILPFPKVSAEQEGYYSTFQYNNAHAVSIPKSASDADKTALLTEAYEMFAHTTILPAYYDYTLTLRAARDNESGEMLELIFANRNLDLALAYNSTTSLQSTLENAVTASSFTFASTEAKSKKVLVKAVEKVLTTIAGFED
ncbi:MAG: hypothetical protein E7576_01390 [Ruminococcaceae bacterium]|nr:hypothetical protein [Oscillospiraceae bacterium]